MQESEKKTAADRRSFLKLLGVGAVTGGAALGAGATETVARGARKDDDGRYQETDHVKTYYDLAKF